VNQIKLALRQLKLRPGLSVVVILMLGLGIGATTAMFSLLSGRDPVVLGGAVAVLAVVVLAGAWLPAGRASRIEPTEALRCE